MTACVRLCSYMCRLFALCVLMFAVSADGKQLVGPRRSRCGATPHQEWMHADWGPQLVRKALGD